MSSDRYVAERAPWYLNGSLSEEENAEVERLLAESDENRQELVDARRAARIYAHRLPIDVIVGFGFDGEHPDVPTQLLERYLAVSPVAGDELDLIRESKAVLDGSTARRDLPDGVVPFDQAPVAAPVARWRGLALAASLLGVITLGLAGWQWLQVRDSANQLATVEQQLREALAREDQPPSDAGLERRVIELESEVTELAAGKSDLVDEIARKDSEIEGLGERIAAMSEPQLNIPVIDVFPGDDMVTRGDEAEADRVVVVPRETRSVALILNSNTDSDQGVTGMVILDAQDEEVWRSPVTPQRDKLGTFTVALPVQDLVTGRYTLQLVDRADGQTRVVETYKIEIR